MWYRFLVSMILLMPVMIAVGAISRPPVDEIDRSAAAFELVPGVLVGDGVVYSMNPEGSIDALSAGSGERLWANSQAAKPLALYAGVLVAQPEAAARAGILDVVLLNRLTGGRLGTLEMELPDQVWGQVDERLGRSFDARGGIRERELYIAWQHHQRWAKGLAPRPDEAVENRLDGAYRLDLVNDLVEAVDPEILRESAPALPSAVQQMVDSGTLTGQPIRAGAILAATTSSIRDGQAQRVLKRWDLATEEWLPDVDLVTGSVVIQLPSADGRHLLIGQRVAAGEWDEYGWSIFGLENGEFLGQVRSHTSHARFFVYDSVLVHEAPPYGRNVGGQWVEAPRRLRGVGLPGGSELWERPLRDPVYRGPHPP